jgi:hypothetical protein
MYKNMKFIAKELYSEVVMACGLSVGTNCFNIHETTTLLHFLESLFPKTRDKWKLNKVLYSPVGKKHSTYNKKEKAN